MTDAEIVAQLQRLLQWRTAAGAPYYVIADRRCRRALHACVTRMLEVEKSSNQRVEASRVGPPPDSRAARGRGGRPRERAPGA